MRLARVLLTTGVLAFPAAGFGEPPTQDPATAIAPVKTYDLTQKMIGLDGKTALPDWSTQTLPDKTVDPTCARCAPLTLREALLNGPLLPMPGDAPPPDPRTMQPQLSTPEQLTQGMARLEIAMRIQNADNASFSEKERVMLVKRAEQAYRGSIVALRIMAILTPDDPDLHAAAQ
jgi:hypothetical protein